VKIIGVGGSNFGRYFLLISESDEMVENWEKLATEKIVDFSMIARRQTTFLMCGLAVVAQY
jgi:hypothetical protein